MKTLLPALLLLLVACNSSKPKEEPTEIKETTMNETVFYVGTYTDGDSEGIYKFKLNEVGHMINLGLVAETDNPSYLAFSESQDFLFAVNETDAANGKGTVVSYKIEKDSLSLINKVSSGGAHPCFITVNENHILVANYTGGNVALIEHDAGIMAEPSFIQQHSGGKLSTRQEKPHAHSSYFIGDKVLSVDLGTNSLWLSTFDKENNWLHLDKPAEIKLPSGAGPRHMAAHPNGKWFYVINELNNTVSLVELNEGKFEIKSSTSTLPKDFKGESFCADIHASNDGKYLYASNRGHNSIAVFEIAEDGGLELIQNQSTNGDWPRNFSLAFNDQLLLVANQRSSNITSYKIDAETGILAFLHEIEAPSPVCLLISN